MNRIAPFGEGNVVAGGCGNRLLRLDRRVGVEAWTIGGGDVPALLRQAARLLEKYKRFFVHSVELLYDDAGEWVVLYGEWMDRGVDE